MDETVFKTEVMRIYDSLKIAILQGDAQALASEDQELRRYWAIALVRGYHTGFYAVNNAMLSVAGMAHSYADHDNPNDPLLLWYRIWESFGETGTMIQRIHIKLIAQERLTEIDTHSFQYDTQTLQFLNKEGMATFSSLLAYMGEVIEKGQNEETCQSSPEERKRRSGASLNYHLRRLVGNGLVDLAGRGIYHLTPLGEQAAKLLEKREPRAECGE